MIPLGRQEILGTSSAQKFAKAKELLKCHGILCDYSITYRNHGGGSGENCRLYVRGQDYLRASMVLKGMMQS